MDLIGHYLDWSSLMSNGSPFVEVVLPMAVVWCGFWLALAFLDFVLGEFGHTPSARVDWPDRLG